MSDSNKRQVGIGVALVSVCLLATEVALTRLFSVTIWYHFAFLAISVALFGTGVAAMTLHLVQRRIPREKTGDHLALSAIALGPVTAGATWILLTFTPDVATGADFDLFSSTTRDLLITFVAAAAPFFVGGFAISLAMTRFPKAIHSLYSWDLFGAAIGCLAVVPLLSLLGAPLTLVFAGGVASLASVFFTSRIGDRRRRVTWRIAGGAIFAILIAMSLTGPSTGLLRLRLAKGLELDEMDIEWNRWNSFSMVSVLDRGAFRGWGMSRAYRGRLPRRKTLVIDMNAMTPLIEFSGDPASASHVSYDLSAFVHRIRPGKPPRSVCVIGAGGGRDVLAALVAGARRVTGVEINPLITRDVMLDAYADYTGHLYERDDVEIHTEDGRGFIKRSGDSYDVIHLSMVDTSAATAAGAYSLTENSLHTVEAFEDYLDHLSDDGILSISSVSMPGLAGGAGLSALARQALIERGAAPSRCVAVVTTPWISRPGCTLHNVLVKPSAFSDEEIEETKTAARQLVFDLAYLPGMRAEEDNLTARVLTARGESAFAALLDSQPLDVTPATDDRPYFFYQNRLTDLSMMLSTSKPSYLFGNGLFVIAKVALVAAGMVLLFLLLPFVFARRDLAAGEGSAGWDLAYVAALGTGFMCVEIALIQKFTLLLGQPTYTLAAVLLAILVGGGLGSRLFARVSAVPARRKLALAIGGIVLLVGAFWLTGLGDRILDAAAMWPLSARVALSVGTLLATGILLGMPYPAGLTAVGARAPERIPWLWAINSATSVLGSVSAVLVSMHAGIPTTLATGGALYVVALLLSAKVMPSRSRP